ncbi:hypothetical protein QYM36_006437 [Artemia franciscana]|uniref:Integrase catalytic domain-containing protein n=1 Tax=Artemia franciscana TaxID=6661 RepID=A0AA88LDK9_ARTSF|nr:hypothetical protein QYM36_006437 [Artemia franciscana]
MYIANIRKESCLKDILGPLVSSQNGHRFLLVISNYCIHCPEAIPLGSIGAKKIAEIFDQYFYQDGFPEEILADQGSNFIAKNLLEVCEIHGIKPIPTSPFLPQTDGLVENLNGRFQLTKKFVMDKPRDWDRFIPFVLFVLYRETPQASTKFSPFELLYGRRPRGPLDLINEQWEHAENSTVRPAHELLSVREDFGRPLKRLIKIFWRRLKGRKPQYNKKAKPRDLEVDNDVLVLMPTETHKLETRWKAILKSWGCKLRSPFLGRKKKEDDSTYQSSSEVSAKANGFPPFYPTSYQADNCGNKEEINIVIDSLSYLTEKRNK